MFRIAGSFTVACMTSSASAASSSMSLVPFQWSLQGCLASIHALVSSHTAGAQ